MLDIQPPPDMSNLIQQLAQRFTSLTTLVLASVDSTVVELARLAYISVLLIGVLLYFTHVERRLGKDLIKGGVILAVLSEFVFPIISKV